MRGPYDSGGDPSWEFRYYPDEEIPRAVSYNRGSQGETPVITAVYTDGLGREVRTAKSAVVEGAYGHVASGHTRYDVMGRPRSQGQPVFASGQPASLTVSDIAGGADVYPVLTAYDVMGRRLRVDYPDDTCEVYTYALDTDEQVMTTRVTDRGGKTVLSGRDVKGNITRVQEMHNGSGSHPVRSTR